ncbi:MAG: iron-only hydrogenase system regulator [Spirochaetales bacterium]|nr:iron-only hydrogenase system regulator [Spirochaetales bacterium]
MEKRIGVISILINDKTYVATLNKILSDYSEIIHGRMGLPMRDKGIHIIALIVEGTTDQLGALTGKIGNLRGVRVKSLLNN